MCRQLQHVQLREADHQQRAQVGVTRRQRLLHPRLQRGVVGAATAQDGKTQGFQQRAQASSAFSERPRVNTCASTRAASMRVAAPGAALATEKSFCFDTAYAPTRRSRRALR